jgi:hypothetical protein
MDSEHCFCFLVYILVHLITWEVTAEGLPKTAGFFNPAPHLGVGLGEGFKY